MSKRKYTLITEGYFTGVEYIINDAKIVDKDDGYYIELDYESKNLSPDNMLRFENYMGEVILDSIKSAIKYDEEHQ